MELIVIVKSKEKTPACGGGGSQNPRFPQKKPTDTVFIWVEIRMEQRPWGGLYPPPGNGSETTPVLPFAACPLLPALPGLAFVFVCFQGWRWGAGGGEEKGARGGVRRRGEAVRAESRFKLDLMDSQGSSFR